MASKNASTTSTSLSISGDPPSHPVLRCPNSRTPGGHGAEAPARDGPVDVWRTSFRRETVRSLITGRRAQMAELQEHESPQRRRSFDDVLKDALTQWTKRFERALEEQRRELGGEAEERASNSDPRTLGHM